MSVHTVDFTGSSALFALSYFCIKRVKFSHGMAWQPALFVVSRQQPGSWVLAWDDERHHGLGFFCLHPLCIFLNGEVELTLLLLGTMVGHLLKWRPQRSHERSIHAESLRDVQGSVVWRGTRGSDQLVVSIHPHQGVKMTRLCEGGSTGFKNKACLLSVRPAGKPRPVTMSG